MNGWLAAALAAYIRFCFRTGRWQRDGFEPLSRHLETGAPVILAIWHQRLIMAPYLFDMEAGRIASLTSAARPGRLAGLILNRLGFEDTTPMSSHTRHVVSSRDVLKRIRDGGSVGIAPDGARGPARQAKSFPIQWARASGAPITVVAFSTRRAITLPTWDRMMLPVPFSRGALVVRWFGPEIPRKLTEAETRALQTKLTEALDAVTEEADRLAGRRASS